SVLTGELKTPNCHGEEKVRRLREWLEQRFGSASADVALHAYGDTAGDKPMLAMADERCAWYRGRAWIAPARHV
ncbi:MAG: hypothetical protein EON54_23585, partial [Alcaligenaceae bacterium]